MKFFLQKIQLFAILFATFFTIISCNKQQANPENISANNTTTNSKFGIITDITSASPFHRRVGAPVDGRTGAKWINNFKIKNGYSKVYYLKSSYLQTILNHVNCVGISMQYAQDTYNNVHVLPMGVDSKGKIMPSAYVSTQNSTITWATAQLWIAKYHGSIKSHFLGSSTFQRLNVSSCTNIRVDFALNDQNIQELLLSNPCLQNAIKQYEDQSLKCPTICPTP